MALPPIELLEKIHQFPGPYTFKIIGAVVDELEARILSAIKEELQLEQDPSYTKRSTADGRHVAITIEITLSSAQDVHKIYTRLLTVTGVVVLL